jgi:drug/metabolite transporter (DMT)-like permease
MYFSLQYLSLSDAVVLKFLAPFLTTFSGALFLKETISPKGIIAGCEQFSMLASVGVYV